MSTIDLGRPAAEACEGSMGEGDGEPLLKGFLRTEEPLSVLFVIMEMRRRCSQNVILLYKLRRS